MKCAIASIFSTADEFALMTELRREAAKRGCDGVVITGEDKVTSTGGYAVWTHTAKFRAICIVFTDAG